MGSYTALPDLTTGDLVTEAWIDGIRNNADYLLNPNHFTQDTNNLLSTTGTTFANIAGASATVTGFGGPYWVTLSVMGASAAGGPVYIDLAVDGSLETNTGLYLIHVGNAAGLSISRLVTGLGSGAHTFIWQWKAAAGTNTGSLTGTRHVAAIEL